VPLGPGGRVVEGVPDPSIEREEVDPLTHGGGCTKLDRLAASAAAASRLTLGGFSPNLRLASYHHNTITMALPASSPAGLDLVPPEHLEPPPGDQQRYVVRDECALLLDGYLRRLARQEACGRRVLGTLARAFLAQKGQHALGFARLGDFARERLGLSARELQSLAHVSARLAQLPAVAAAFAAGALSWTQVRLLVGVATAETAAAWVETARSRTVRA